MIENWRIRELITLSLSLIFASLYVIDIFGFYDVVQYLPESVVAVISGQILLISAAIVLFSFTIAFVWRRIEDEVVLPEGTLK